MVEHDSFTILCISDIFVSEINLVSIFLFRFGFNNCRFNFIFVLQIILVFVLVSVNGFKLIFVFILFQLTKISLHSVHTYTQRDAHRHP